MGINVNKNVVMAECFLWLKEKYNQVIDENHARDRMFVFLNVISIIKKLLGQVKDNNQGFGNCYPRLVIITCNFYGNVIKQKIFNSPDRNKFLICGTFFPINSMKLIKNIY